MDTEGFLARVIPPAGNYASVGWFSMFKGNRLFHTRSWPVGNYADAANTIAYWAGRGHDVYHALASFTAAEVVTAKSGRQHVEARRVVANAHSLKCLIVDADVAYEGMKKASPTFPDRASALRWIADFCHAISLPRPNLVVDSGHGYHFYWLLETPLPVALWQPLAEALRAAMVANAWVCDTQSTVDAARILRPHGSVNLKSGTPAPVGVIDCFTAADYPNALITTALTPWVAVQRATGTHGGAGASVHNLGPRPADLPLDTTTNAAAQAGFVQRPHKFANIHPRCEQLKLTVAQHGAKQSRDHWRLGDLPLLTYCVDGDGWAHPVSDGYSGYTEAETTREYADAKRRNPGPPLCTSYDAYRPGVCTNCRYRGQIKTPLHLGLDDADLPDGYRRMNPPARIERRHGQGEDESWEIILEGDLHTPTVRRLPSGSWELTLTYTFGGDDGVLAVAARQVADTKSLHIALSDAGITCKHQNASAIGDLIVAWINKLRAAGQVNRDIVSRPFGWNMLDGEISGLAIGGDFYTAKGTVERLACEDRALVQIYTPTGTLAAWRQACALFEGPTARPDHQALIACNFGAPLFALTSEARGMTLNFWSAASGIGKSTAIRIGQAVWGNYTAMQSMRDTPNSVMKSLSGPRVLVRYWDEFRLANVKHQEFSDLVFQMPQGKERMRMGPSLELRPMGEWETLLVLTSNRAYADVLLIENDSTDAGVLRLIDVEMDKTQVPFDPKAGMIIKGTETNFGHAGREYAAWLGRNGLTVKAQLSAVLEALTKDLSLQREERYYAAAIAAVVVGASLAKKLGLFNCDVPAIYQVFKQSVLAARATRGARVVVTTGGRYDIADILGQFLNAMGDARIRTDIIARPGHAKVRVTLHPKRTEAIVVQIADQDGKIRLHRRQFESWLHEHNLPATSVLNQMRADWGACEGRFSIAGGTDYKAGQIACIDIPRGSPDLEEVFV